MRINSRQVAEIEKKEISVQQDKKIYSTHTKIMSQENLLDLRSALAAVMKNKTSEKSEIQPAEKVESKPEPKIAEKIQEKKEEKPEPKHEEHKEHVREISEQDLKKVLGLEE